MNILLIAGSRDITLKNVPHLYHIFDNLSYTFNRNFDYIIHGNARGVDKLGEAWAEGKGYETKPYPADWNRLGKRAGYVRNRYMATIATHAIIVWDGESPGTRSMFDICIGRNIPVALRTVNIG